MWLRETESDRDKRTSKKLYQSASTVCRSAFRTLSKIYDGVFAKIVKGFKLLNIFAKKLHHWMFDKVLNTPLAPY